MQSDAVGTSPNSSGRTRSTEWRQRQPGTGGLHQRRATGLRKKTPHSSTMGVMNSVK